ncbi:MAG: alpha/beta fold hydrolase [Rhodobacterales bacterium]|nr:alpha/beta fold hydrolase [Rhodobacterales bacterium]MDX5390882.1 alpha/beta fold hydrolase [Rhodobacterales bacterium]MDX5490577.1 alpha/beta fold hydrolase [Rhodobacterales bacterium]
MLNIIRHGEDQTGIPLLIVHGLFGTGRNWGVIARRLAQKRPVIAVDMRNHGDSPRHPTHSYQDMAGDLAEVIEANGGQADVLGHSMGGKAAMVLALTRPDLVRRLIVADIAPVAYAHTQSHRIAAMKAMDLTDLSTRAEADRRLALTVEDPGLRAFFLQSLDLKSQPPRWKLNLDVLDAEMPGIIGFPQIEGAYDGPTLFLTGAESDYVRPEHRPRIQQLFPKARFARLAGAGHWLHADKPREFETAVATWLEATGG